MATNEVSQQILLGRVSGDHLGQLLLKYFFQNFVKIIFYTENGWEYELELNTKNVDNTQMKKKV